MQGGRHTDYVAEQISSKLIEVSTKKANKSGITVKPFQIRNHMWVFVNALIENPTFDSQTKETMTLAYKNFGSKFTFGEDFGKSLMKVGIVEAVVATARREARTLFATTALSSTVSAIVRAPQCIHER